MFTLHSCSITVAHVYSMLLLIAVEVIRQVAQCCSKHTSFEILGSAFKAAIVG